MTGIQSGLESYHAKVAAIADGQKEPHLHINLPDLTGLEDKYQNILRHISDINNRKASTEDVRNLCEKVQLFVRQSVADPLASRFDKLQETVVTFNERMEAEVLKNSHLKILNTFMAVIIIMVIFIFISTPPTSRSYKRDAEKYQIMKSMNREADTMYYYLDRIYSSPRNRKAIKAQRESMAVRNTRRIKESYKTE